MNQPQPRREAPPHSADSPRLQKTLALAGVGSRRACEALIESGRVSVDGQTVRQLGIRIDPARHRIAVDGLTVETNVQKTTLALHKPYGVISAMVEPDGRPCLGEYVQQRNERLYHIGRLDTDSEGLILLTNDGELANRVAHPKYELVKTYLVTVEGKLSTKTANRLRRGFELDDGPAKVDRLKLIDTLPGATLLELDIHQGRNRVIRRLMDAAGHSVTGLVRTRVGPIRLGDLKPGRTRVLSAPEVASLKQAVEL
ncbi:MAG: rRNA pseudouridine synthase [Micrococcales bacterium]|nr:rRNA pseudouridine synthase [Micrococcales bacterium]